MSASDQPALESAMARFAAGEDAALAAVYDLASPAVFTFLLRMCRDRPLAEDLTQETFMRIHRARGLYRPGAPVLPWAFTIARRLFLDSVRARRQERTHSVETEPQGSDAGAGGTGAGDVASSLPSPEQMLADAELAQSIEEALAKIPEAQAVAFRLLKGEGLSVAETAAVMGTTRGAIKLRAHRAYEALRKLLEHRPANKKVGRRADGGTT